MGDSQQRSDGHRRSIKNKHGKPFAAIPPKGEFGSIRSCPIQELILHDTVKLANIGWILFRQP